MNNGIMIGIFLALISPFGLQGMEGQLPDNTKKRPLPEKQQGSQKKARIEKIYYTCPEHVTTKIGSRTGLMLHIDKYHYNQTTEQYDCPIHCGNSFCSPYAVVLHLASPSHAFFDIKKNTLLPPKVIETISQSFCPIHIIDAKTISTLTDHVRIHHCNKDNQRFYCSHNNCPRSFSTAFDVVKHWASNDHRLFTIKNRKILPIKNDEELILERFIFNMNDEDLDF